MLLQDIVIIDLRTRWLLKHKEQKKGVSSLEPLAPLPDYA